VHTTMYNPLYPTKDHIEKLDGHMLSIERLDNKHVLEARAMAHEYLGDYSTFWVEILHPTSKVYIKYKGFEGESFWREEETEDQVKIFVIPGPEVEDADEVNTGRSTPGAGDPVLERLFQAAKAAW